MLDSSAFIRAVPLIFTFLWSTGWVVAGYAAPYADALTFLLVRYACAFLAVAAFAFAAGASWPKGRAIGAAIVSGILIHAIYLGAVWWAVRHGLPAGISGLIAGLQPILTALFAPALAGERISPIRWAGVVCGFLGIALVLEPKLAGLTGAALAAVLGPVLINIVGMVAVTAGSFYQKARVAGDLRTVTAWQYLGAFFVTLPAAWLLEPMRITWNPTMVLVLLWSAFGLSLGGIGLYFLMLRRGEVSRIATFLYLVPPAVAVQAWLLFGETMTPVQIGGMVVVVLGVILASRR